MLQTVDVARRLQLPHPYKLQLQELPPPASIRRELSGLNPFVLLAQIHCESNCRPGVCDRPLYDSFPKRFQIGVDVPPVSRVCVPSDLLRLVVPRHERERVVDDRAFLSRVFAPAEPLDLQKQSSQLRLDSLALCERSAFSGAKCDPPISLPFAY